MDFLRGVWARLRAMLARRSAEREMEDELAFHVEMETRKLMADGLGEEEARRRALVAFGGVERHKEAIRDGRRLGLLEDLLRDGRFAARGVVRNPGFLLVAILTIALGVGATTAVFSVANRVLLSPLPVAEPDRLAVVSEQRSGAVSKVMGQMAIPYERYEEYAEATREVFSGLAAERWGTFALRTADETVAANGVLTSGNYFAVLGLRPAVGSFFTRDHEPVVVLSHALWRTRFGGDPAVVGRTVYVDGRPFQVIGVAPAGFGGTMMVLTSDLWVPIRSQDRGNGGGWSSEWVIPFGRLLPGVDRGRAAAVVDAVARRLPPGETHTEVRGARLNPLTGLGDGRGVVAAFIGMLMATAVLVLLIASANIAGMLMARAVTRRREMAVRLAIGAGRLRIVRQLLTESLLLFLLGGAAGVLVALGGTWLIGSIRVPRVEYLVLDFTPDLRVLTFALALTALTGLAFGLLPALQASRPELVTALKEGTPGAGNGSTRSRSLFVAGQVAMSVLLLVTAGLFVRSLQRGLAVDPGFDPDGVVVGTINLGPHGYDEERGRAFYAELVDRARRLPGVEAASLAQIVLLAGDRSGNDVTAVVEGQEEAPRTNASWNVVDPDYFEAMRIDLVAGRGISAADAAGSPPVAVVNQTLAARLWPGESPLGRRFRAGHTEMEVVGVSRDGRYVSVHEESEPFAFTSAAQAYRARMTLHVRSTEPSGEVIRRIAAEVRELDPNVALEGAAPLAAVIGFSLFPQRFAASLVGVFGVLGLILAAIGVYGILAFQVAQRTREFGIRIALGARADDVLRLVLSRGLRLTMIGAAAGLLLAAAVTHLLQGFLFSVGPFDPVTFFGAAAAIGAAALVASYLPARRAVRVPPAVALRSE